MQVKPVKTSKAHTRRPLPTAAEVAANPDLVAPAPPRAPRGIGAALGAGFLGTLLAQVAKGAEPAVQPPPAATLDAERAASDADAAAKAEAARRRVATLVAPMLQKALDEDGRGAFGCVAVDPPTFLSENEALNLIEQEFAKAGVKLRDCYELTGFSQTRTDWKSMLTAAKSKAKSNVIPITFDDDSPRPQKRVPGKWVFDLATEDGSLLVEYLSSTDHEKLKDEQPGFICTAWGCDFPQCATRFREDLASRTNGAPVTVALFFDPLASVYNWTKDGMAPRPGSRFEKMSEKEIDALDWNKRHEMLRQDALDKLLEQIRFFLDWARKEGKLPAP